ERDRMYPADRRYSQQHEWAKRVDDGTLRVGITHYAQEQLGDIVFLDLPQVGAVLGRMQKLGEVESVKSVSEVYSPISGEVVEVNQEVMGRPELANFDPHEKGWLVRMKPSEPGEMDELMTAADYESFLKSLGV
ncbi:MAG: Glycine cleavage system protein, partial [Dehalococcoidia bacterium]|nr:Glycine cleavage system protein [Dehalococcoidia bacterium]